MNRYEQIPVLPEPSGASGPGGRLVAAAVAALTVLAVLAGFQRLADRFHDPRIPYLSDRFELLRRDPDPADVVFIGTSVVHRNIDAGHMNELAAASGCGLTFVNLGAPAMSVAELDLLLGRLGRGASGPRFVAYSPVLYDGLTRIDSRRASWANRVGALPLALASLEAAETTARTASRPEHEGDGFAARLAFARHWLASSLRAGEAAHWLLRDHPGPHHRTVRRRQRDNAGFLALEEDPRIRPDRAAAFRRQVDSWRASAETSRAMAASFYRGQRPLELPEADRRLQDRLLERVRRTGAEPMAVFPPQVAFQSRLVEFYRQRLGDAGVLDYGFYRHPEFLDPELWFDRAHLNREGSRRLSELLWERFCGR